MRQTDFTNDEAVGYLADRLARLGVEEALVEAGAQARAPRSSSATRGRRGRLRLGADAAAPAPSTCTAAAAPTCGWTGGDRVSAAAALSAAAGAGRAPRATPRRRQGRLVVADHRRRAASTATGSTRSSTCSPARAPAGARSCWSPPARSRPGWRRSACRARPRDLATQQAAASVGQGLLVHRYTAGFARHGLTVGQVLLTADDVIRRAHYRNAQRTLHRLLELGVVPVVNENDTVATDEIRFGDNDRLAALVAHLVHADVLVLLSDVDALYDGDPRRPGARRIAEVRGAADLAGVALGRAGAAGVGTGGMVTKVEAARIATGAGIPVVLAAAAQAAAALAGDDVGTCFAPDGPRAGRPGCCGWRTPPTPRGRLRLDAGRGARPSSTRRSRCCPAGVTGVEGSFAAGDPVDLVDENGHAVARGLVNYDATELPGAARPLHPRAGRASSGPAYEREVVHRDDLVLLRHVSAQGGWTVDGRMRSPGDGSAQRHAADAKRACGTSRSTVAGPPVELARGADGAASGSRTTHPFLLAARLRRRPRRDRGTGTKAPRRRRRRRARAAAVGRAPAISAGLPPWRRRRPRGRRPGDATSAAADQPARRPRRRHGGSGPSERRSLPPCRPGPVDRSAG